MLQRFLLILFLHSRIKMENHLKLMDCTEKKLSDTKDMLWLCRCFKKLLWSVNN